MSETVLPPTPRSRVTLLRALLALVLLAGGATAGVLVLTSSSDTSSQHTNGQGQPLATPEPAPTPSPTPSPTPRLELRATVVPDGGTYGIGQPLIVRFNRPVKGPVARQAVLDRLHVTTTPAVVGAWRWYNSFEVHYRPEVFWKPGTTVSATADLAGLQLPDSPVWGADRASTGGMRIGEALVATVDVTAHTMTVRRNGVVVRVVNVSTGRDKYPTKGGVHIVLKREAVHLYNSATVGIPTASPDGYYEKLPWSVRISNGGAFVHANPQTVKYQGVLNVSHGCVNASVADAKWFYDNSHLGDVVTVIHAAVGPLRTDAGMADWNYPWATWKLGNLGT